MFRTLVVASLVVVAMLGFASAARAEGPEWSYIEAGYLNVDPDNLDSGNAWFAGGSMKLFEMLHANGRYIDGDYTDNVDFTYWELGAGWHGLLGDEADLLAEATWVNTEIGNVDDDGLGLTAGIRWNLAEFLELDGFANWVDYDADAEASYEAKAIFDIWKVGIGAGVEFGDDENQYNAFVRFNFDRK